MSKSKEVIPEAAVEAALNARREFKNKRGMKKQGTSCATSSKPQPRTYSGNGEWNEQPGDESSPKQMEQ